MQVIMGFKKLLTLSACIILSSAHPAEKLPVLRDTQAEQLFKDGERAVLECIVEGGQNVKYTWQKNASPFSPSSDIVQRKDVGSIEFPKPTAADEGFYICTAETSFGKTMTRGTMLTRVYLNAPQVSVQRHKAIEGRPFKLDCPSPDANPKPIISWKTQLDGTDKVEDFLNRRITPSPDGTLWFSNVTREDANPKSKYICVAKSSAFDKEVVLAEHYINELEADSKPNNGELVPQYVSNDIFAKAGDITMIWCIYGGSPQALTDWYKDGKDVNGKPGDRVTRHNRTACRRLLIKDTRLEDEGSYKCVANNEVGKPVEHTVKVTVGSPPAFSKKPEKQTLVKEGQDITIPCQVSGTPASHTTFIYNGQELKTSARVSTGPEGITIKKLQKVDGGYYGCRIVGRFGQDYQETLVRVM